MFRRTPSNPFAACLPVIVQMPIFFALFLLAMIIGNHTGRIEDLYLIAFAAGTIFLVVRGWWMNRGKWS